MFAVFFQAMNRKLFVVVLAVALVGAGVASSAILIPPANAPLPVIAKQYLNEIAGLKARPIVVRCVTFPGESIPAAGFVTLGAAHILGNTIYLSTRYVCKPLAVAWRNAPIFTGRARPSIPLASVDAVETVAHEWFNTRGVRTECHAVQYTWKWLRRGDYPPSFLRAARRHLMDNGRRPPGYKIPANCLGPT